MNGNTGTFALPPAMLPPALRDKPLSLTGKAGETLGLLATAFQRRMQRKDELLEQANAARKQAEERAAQAHAAATQVQHDAASKTKEAFKELGWRAAQVSTGVGLFVGLSIAESGLPWMRIPIPILGKIRPSAPIALATLTMTLVGPFVGMSHRATEFLSMACVGSSNAYLSPFVARPSASSSASSASRGAAEARVSGPDDRVIFGR